MSAALLIARRDANEIRLVLEFVGGNAIRNARFPRAVDEQLGLPFGIAACLTEVLLRGPVRIELCNIGSGGCGLVSATQVRIGHSQEGVIKGKRLLYKEPVFYDVLVSLAEKEDEA